MALLMITNNFLILYRVIIIPIIIIIIVVINVIKHVTHGILSI